MGSKKTAIICNEFWNQKAQETVLGPLTEEDELFYIIPEPKMDMHDLLVRIGKYPDRSTSILKWESNKDIQPGLRSFFSIVNNDIEMICVWNPTKGYKEQWEYCE